MPTRQRIAIATELDWALRRHYEVIGGIQEYAETHAPEWEIEVCRYPEARIADGTKFAGIVGRISNECLTAAEGTPLVNTWMNSPVAGQVPCVFIDPRESGRMATKHLIARGLRRFAHIGIRGQNAPNEQYQGVLDVTREHGFSCSRHRVINNAEDTPENWNKFTTQVRKIMKSWQPPVGVVAWDDTLSRALLSCFPDSQLICPEQLAVVGTGNSEMTCNIVAPTLSSVDLGHHQSGYAAAATLHQLMKGEPAPEKPIYTPPKELVVRRSSDVFAVRDPKVATALRFMADNCDKPLSVPIIAENAEIGRQTLERRFRDQIGRTINNELIRLRVERLKRLLVETDDSVKELSPKVGFGTTVNMFNSFKKFTGMTPAAYRKKHGDEKRW